MYCFECDSDTTASSGICDFCGKPLTADADRYFKTGMEALASGSLERAIKLLDSCIQVCPTHINGLYNLGVALALNGQNNDAWDAYVAVLNRDPEYPGIYTALGQIAFGNYLYHSEHAEAQRQAMFRLFERAIEGDEDDIDAYFSLANAYMAVGSAEKALPHLKQALKIEPKSAAIHYSLAKAFLMLERYREASVMADISMQLSTPDDPFREDIQHLVNELQRISYEQIRSI